MYAIFNHTYFCGKCRFFTIHRSYETKTSSCDFLEKFAENHLKSWCKKYYLQTLKIPKIWKKHGGGVTKSSQDSRQKKRFISVWGLGLGISINHILSYIHLHLPNGDWASQDTPRCFYREKPPSGHFGTILQTVSLCKKNGASASLRSFSSQASNASSRPHWRCHTNQDVQIQKQLRVSWAFHRIPHVISFKSSWCLNHPLEKYARHNGFIFPKSIESTIFQHQHMW